MKKIIIALYLFSFSMVSCQQNETPTDFLNKYDCSNEIELCLECDKEQSEKFEEEIGINLDSTIYSSGNDYTEFTKREWDLWEYKNSYNENSIYQRENDGDYKVLVYVGKYSTILFYELDTTLAKYKNKPLKELQAIVKEKMIRISLCYQNNKNYTLDYSFHMYEGFYYENDFDVELKRHQVYEMGKLEKDKCNINNLHNLESIFYHEKNGGSISFEYDDIEHKRTMAKGFNSTLMFTIEVD